jgi:hypothetical protein
MGHLPASEGPFAGLGGPALRELCEGNVTRHMDYGFSRSGVPDLGAGWHEVTR